MSVGGKEYGGLPNWTRKIKYNPSPGANDRGRSTVRRGCQEGVREAAWAARRERGAGLGQSSPHEGVAWWGAKTFRLASVESGGNVSQLCLLPSAQIPQLLDA